VECVATNKHASYRKAKAFTRATKMAYSYVLLQHDCMGLPLPGADPGVGKGKGTNKLSVARWLENKAK